MAAAIQGISNLVSTHVSALDQAPAALETLPNAATPFSDLLTDAMGEVNSLHSEAESAITGLMTGTGVDVHTAMIATEKASMAFELSLAVRNKALQAYPHVMSMQF